MKITTPFMLAADVRILAANTIDKNYLHGLDYAEHDYIIFKPYSRQKIKLISKELAAFLRYFHTPKNFNDAILEYAKDFSVEPLTLLENVYPTVKKLIEANFLLSEQAKDNQEISLAIGEFIEGIHILKKVQCLEDIDVYHGIKTEKTYVALKLGKTVGPHHQITQKLIANEKNILEKIRSLQHVVQLIQDGSYQNCPYIVTKWIEGKSLEQHLKSISLKKNSEAAFALCTAVLYAYRELHRLKVLHRDVNPRNIIIKDNKVYLIDFALAADLNDETTFGLANQLGTDYYTTPEEANAKLNKKKHLPTLQMEQYKIAVLLYLICTGRHYLNFKKERDDLLKQILEQQPNDFLTFCMCGFSETEKVLKKALDKHPENRYQDTQNFYDAFCKAATHDLADFKEDYDNNYQKQFLHVITEKLLPHSTIIKNYFVANSPYCSLSYGGAGIAYFFYRLAMIQNNPQYLAYADIWNHVTLKHIENPEAFWNNAMGLTEENILPASLYYSLSGVYFVQILINLANGDYVGAKRYFDKYADCVTNNLNNGDLMFGVAGTLLACANFYENTMNNPVFDSYNIISLATRAKESVIAMLTKNIVQHNGIAHGVAGLLYAIAKWNNTLGIPLESEIVSYIDALLTKAKVSTETICWPITQHKEEFSLGWCNGTAGYICLFTQLYKLSKNSLYLLTAQKCAQTIIHRELYSTDLCCGLTGCAFSLLNLYQIDHDIIWLNKAKIYAESAVKNIHYHALKPFSLLKGFLGVALLIAELDQPLSAVFPILE